MLRLASSGGTSPSLGSGLGLGTTVCFSLRDMLPEDLGAQRRGSEAGTHLGLNLRWDRMTNAGVLPLPGRKLPGCQLGQRLVDSCSLFKKDFIILFYF